MGQVSTTNMIHIFQIIRLPKVAAHASMLREVVEIDVMKDVFKQPIRHKSPKCPRIVVGVRSPYSIAGPLDQPENLASGM